ncbi:MAG TPA: DUF1631 family protein [Arenimonas sp.]|nr:DUF1631 family protein [Arenimonas sp.]
MNTLSLAAASAAPARSRSSARAEMRDWASDELSRLLDTVLDQAEGWLFEQAAAARHGPTQQRLFDSLNQLRQRRRELLQRLRESLHRTEKAAAEGADLPGGFGPGVRQARTLCLVEGDALEEQLAGERLIEACERRLGPALAPYAEQAGRLWDFGTAQSHRNPFGPLQIAIAFRDSFALLDGFDPEERVRLYGLLERALPEWCAQLPAAFAQRVPASALSPTVAEAPLLRPTTPAAPVASAQPIHAAPTAERRAANEPVDPQWFALREAFGEYLRQRRGETGNGVAPAPELGDQTVLLALDALQQEPPTAVLEFDGDGHEGLADCLRAVLLAEAGKAGRCAPGSVLGRSDEQALLFVGMLFETLLEQGSYSPAQRRRWLHLCIPYTKLALLDRRLLTGRSHAGRRVLDALVEAFDGNEGNTAADRALQGEAETVLTRIIGEFDRDPGLFAGLAEALDQGLDQHRQRVAIAEQRAAEAQRGRERLEQARQQADLRLQLLLEGVEWPHAVHEFLCGPWQHHLSLLWLRSGPDSLPVDEAMALARDLRNACLAAQRGAQVDPEMLWPGRAVLASSGVHGDAAEQVLQQLLAAMQPSVHAPAGTSAGAADEALHDTAHHAAMPVSGALDPLLLPVVPPLPVVDDAAAREAVARLRVGDWVEFVDAGGEARSAKLSWLSPISERLLFVNRRGARIGVYSRCELSALVTAGQLKLRNGDGAFEQAMSAVLGRLANAPSERRQPPREHVVNG